MEKLEKYILLISFLTSFLTVFIVNGLTLAAPSFGSEFAMSNLVQNWVFAITLLFISAFTIPAGQICSKYGCKKSLVIGNSIFLIGLILSALSLSSEMFLFSRVIQGIGYAFQIVSGTAIIVLAMGKESRGKSLGIVVVGSYLGYIVSPLLGGYLINNFGWRSLFYISIPLLAFAILLTILKVKEEWITNENEKIDKIGILLYMVGIIFFIYGFSDLLTFFGQISIVLGIIILILFGIYENKIELPVFNIKLLKEKTFLAYNLTGFFEFFAIAVFDVLFAYYFQYVKGWDAQLTGLILIISPVVLAIVSPNAGKLSDRMHPEKLATIGLSLMFVAIVGLIFLDMGTPVYMIVLLMIIVALGTALFSVPNQNAVMSAVSEKYASYASATHLTLRLCGQTMSLALLTVVCSFIMGNLPLSPENAGLLLSSSRIISIICALLCLIAIFVSIWGIRSESA